jgi:hypothetical protein
MKKLLLILGVFVLSTAHAQYFQRQNGNAPYDELADGLNTTVGAAGHLMVGSTQIAGGQNLVLTRTNANGVIGAAPTFNRNFSLTTTTNIPLIAMPCKVLQIPNGRTVVVGSYVSNIAVVPPGIFTAVFAANGNVISVRSWQTTQPAPSITIFATSACNALPGSSTVYICGYSDVSTSSNGGRPLIMAINGTTNTLIWGQIHDFVPAVGSKLIPTDLIASPYQPFGVSEVFIVGTHYMPGGIDQVFTYRIDTVTGSPVGLATLFDSGRNDEFTAVCLATGTGGGNSGFLITGSTNFNGDWDAIALKIDDTGSIIYWSNIMDYSAGGDNYGADVIQRLNTSNQWNYYMAGTVSNGSMGGSDMVVFFIDDLGMGNNEFTYGTIYSERCSEISNNLTGISVYGNAPTASDAGQEYYVRAYYNGVSGCNESFAAPLTIFYSLTPMPVPPTVIGAVASTNLLLTLVSTPTISTLCFSATIATGSNAREAQIAEPSASSGLYPNPVAVNAAVLNLNLNSPTEQQIEIRITDMLGREVLNQTIVVAEGESLQQIQLPSGISAGVYNMSINGNGVKENHRFIME